MANVSTNFNFSSVFWFSLAVVVLALVFRNDVSAYLKREPATK